jgi:integrase
VLGLRWRPSSSPTRQARIRIAETIVHGRPDTPRSAASERTLAIAPVVSAELFEHRGRARHTRETTSTCSFIPRRLSPRPHKRYAASLKVALARAEVSGPVRPFHDFRHTAITHEAAAGNAPAAIQARAEHADFSTTQRYINLAGVVFKEEADRAEARVLGGPIVGTETAEEG